MPENMVTTTCPTPTCGVPFSVPEHVFKQAQQLGENRKVYCPNGHSVIWKVTDAERLQKRVDELERSTEQLRSLNHHLEDDSEKADRTIRYWRGWAKHWKAKAQSKAAVR